MIIGPPAISRTDGARIADQGHFCNHRLQFLIPLRPAHRNKDVIVLSLVADFATTEA